MELIDSRRLTGPNLLSMQPGAVLDVEFGQVDAEALIRGWHESLQAILAALGWASDGIRVRRLPGGAQLAFAAPIDALYAATEINEWAWARADRPPGDEEIGEAVAKFGPLIEEECNPALIALQQAALARGVTMLPDDDEVSLGLGCHSRTWPARALPAPGELDWQDFAQVPVGLVTGTNGKTTSVRLIAAMARAAGFRIGLSSTDWIEADGEILDHGDYSGPGGARAILRDRRVDFAILETARGGLQRRGLALNEANAVLITNIAADHLGEFGVNTLQDLADIKWITTAALGERRPAILNAEDPLLVERSEGAVFPLTWFSIDPDCPVLRKHVTAGGHGCTVEDDALVWYGTAGREVIVGLDNIPVTLGGAARHNVANAAAASALALEMGIPIDAVAAGLREVRVNENLGRCNVYRINGATVVMDFAHNPHGVEAVLEMAAALPAKRRAIILGQAGDRGDEAILDLAGKAWAIQPDLVVLKEMARYARGRAPGEVVALLRRGLQQAGAPADVIEQSPDEPEAVRTVVDWVRPGDLALVLVHADFEGVGHYLENRQDESES